MSSTVSMVVGRSPRKDGTQVPVKAASVRALRTFLEGIAAAFPAAGAGAAILSTGYWATVGYSCLAAAVTALASFLNNIALFLPEDPTQAGTSRS